MDIRFIFTASISRLIATVNYKKSMMTCYVGYQYFQVAGRAANLVFYTNSNSISPIDH